MSSRILGEPLAPSRPFAQPPSEDPVAAELARARAQGLSDGRAEARSHHEAEVAGFHVQMAETLARLAELEQALRAEHEARLLEIALAAASRIVRERIEAGDAVAQRALAEALAALPSSGRLSVRLHPDDLPGIAEHLAPQLDAGRLALIEDRSLARGGCVVEGGPGRVDARLEVAEAAVRAAALMVETVP